MMSSKLVDRVHRISRSKSAQCIRMNRLCVHNTKCMHLYSTLSALSETKEILILGSGLCSKPVVDYLSQTKMNNNICLASRNMSTATEISSKYRNCTSYLLDGTDSKSVHSLLSSRTFDIVISLLPPLLHDDIAKLCIEYKTDFVTASYWSDSLEFLNNSAMDNKLTFVGENGFDPGFDQMAAINVVNRAQLNGEYVTSLFTTSGAIPSPLSNDNPFGYKFSWSPIGLLKKCVLDAKYLADGNIVDIDGTQLLGHAVSFGSDNFYKTFESLENIKFEVIPNRNSIKYISEYNIYNQDKLKNMYRGNIRYKGFSQILSGFNVLGLLDDDNQFKNELNETWSSYLQRLLGYKYNNKFKSINELLEHMNWSKKDIINFLNAYNWLNIENDRFMKIFESPRIAFCDVLEHKLRFADNEEDIALIYHEIDTESADGKYHKKYINSLLVYGDDEYSAIARVTGIPTAIAAQLVLDGKLNNPKGFGIKSARHPLIIDDIFKECEKYKIKMNQQEILRNIKLK
eukprot:271331_1